MAVCGCCYLLVGGGEKSFLFCQKNILPKEGEVILTHHLFVSAATQVESFATSVCTQVPTRREASDNPLNIPRRSRIGSSSKDTVRSNARKTARAHNNHPSVRATTKLSDIWVAAFVKPSTVLLAFFFVCCPVQLLSCHLFLRSLRRNGLHRPRPNTRRHERRRRSWPAAASRLAR